MHECRQIWEYTHTHNHMDLKISRSVPMLMVQMWFLPSFLPFWVPQIPLNVSPGLKYVFVSRFRQNVLMRHLVQLFFRGKKKKVVQRARRSRTIQTGKINKEANEWTTCQASNPCWIGCPHFCCEPLSKLTNRPLDGKKNEDSLLWHIIRSHYNTRGIIWDPR